MLNPDTSLLLFKKFQKIFTKFVLMNYHYDTQYLVFCNHQFKSCYSYNTEKKQFGNL